MPFFSESAEAQQPRSKPGDKTRATASLLYTIYREMHRSDPRLAAARAAAISAATSYPLLAWVLAPLALRRGWNRLGMGEPISRKQARGIVTLLGWSAVLVGHSMRQGQRGYDEERAAIKAYKDAMRDLAAAAREAAEAAEE